MNQKSYSFSPAILKLFQNRGMSPQDIQDFLSWDLKELPDLTQMHDMEVASERIICAIENHELIGIYGDYDVDGTTSCALFYHFFKILGLTVELIQPSRFVEGYGLHASSIDLALSKNIDLLITVDCGITSNDAALYAKEKNLDLIITDHHKDAAPELPCALAVVNPNRRDEPKNSPLSSLAGVGVAFAICINVRNKLIAKGHKIPSLSPLLPFVAIGTICDLAFLNPMNIKLVRHGLRLLKETLFPGLRSFFTPSERELSFISSEKISFHVGPLINSKGRLDHPEMALKLLISDNPDEAYRYYSHLEICNKERKAIQQEVYEEAKAQVVSHLKIGPHLISIVFAPHWHEGVIGIVASKLVETFKVPALVFTQTHDPEILKASIRSAGDLNIFDLLNNHKDLFLKFGGHKAAAGLSLKKENLDILKERLYKDLLQMPESLRTKTFLYDLEISPSEINAKLARDLELLEPFGMGNPKPIFKVRGLTLDSYDILREVHTRWNFSSRKNPQYKFKGISFNYIDKWGVLPPEDIFSKQQRQLTTEKPWELADDLSVTCSIGVNRFRGNEYLQLMVEQVGLGT